MWKTLRQACQVRPLGGCSGLPPSTTTRVASKGASRLSSPLLPSAGICFSPKHATARVCEPVLQRASTGGGGVSRAVFTLAAVESDKGSGYGIEALAVPEYCPGCGIKLQDHDKDAPGYYQLPAAKKGDPRSLGLWTDDPPVEEDGIRTSSDDASTSSGFRTDVFCARCFSLRNYGKVKNPEIEDQLPSFDVASKLCTRIANIKGIRQVLLCVVDITDFDGSLPVQTLSRIFSDPQIREKNVSVVLALNKLDLLPRVASDQRLRTWAKRQISSLDLPQDVSVKLVSAAVGKGIPDLAATLQAKIGQYGHLWVFGAQNAGKSSLINALRRFGSGEGRRDGDGEDGGEGRRRKKGKARKGPLPQLTEASLPGTTIGFVRLDNLLSGSRCKAFDTPGLLHRHQFTSTHSPLTYAEIAMLLPKRKLKPRTFRCQVGYSVSIGGLARIDLIDAPGNSVYFTLWCSDEVTTHFGKTEKAEQKQAQAVGDKLFPPSDPDNVPNLVSSDFLVEGSHWQRSSEDISIAGLGWMAVGVSGQCQVRAWAPKSVLVYQRMALMPDYAKEFERPGYGMMLPKDKKHH